jgi:hypothetical protein
MTGAPAPYLADASLTDICDDGIQVWIIRDGDRWELYTNAANGRRCRVKDFASPFRDHARRTAEMWYGVPKNQWAVYGGEE